MCLISFQLPASSYQLQGGQLRGLQLEAGGWELAAFV
jgi:hypothetical protein